MGPWIKRTFDETKVLQLEWNKISTELVVLIPYLLNSSQKWNEYWKQLYLIIFNYKYSENDELIRKKETSASNNRDLDETKSNQKCD